MSTDSAIPLIDISKLRSNSLAERTAVAMKLGEACRGTGFFYLTGHGIPDPLIEAVFAASRRFFGLDIETKRMVSVKRSAGFHGYFGLSEERLDLEAAPDLKEGFGISLDLMPDDPRLQQPFRAQNQWPDLPDWRGPLLDYFDRCWELGRLLHQGFSIDLGLDEFFFEDKLDEPLAGLRLLHYPPASTGASPNGAPGAGAHTDYGNLTILAVDDVAGLQLQRRDQVWIDAPTVPGALICNIGDCLMRWTNDTYVSTPHRVTIPHQDRYSIAFFLDPNPDAEVVPVLGGVEAVRRYPPISGADYLRSRLEPTFLVPEALTA